MQDVNDRLATLERRLRRMQFLALGSFAALVLVVGVAATRQADTDLQVRKLTAASIDAESITVRDDQGRPRISLQLLAEGGPFVALLNEDSRVRLLMTLHEKEHPLLQFSDANESPQMNLFYNKELGAGLIQFGTAGRALYAVPTGGQPLVELYDDEGEKIFAAP